MPFLIEALRRAKPSVPRPALALLVLALGCGSLALAESGQEARPSPTRSLQVRAAWVDLGAAAWSGLFSALHPRLGVELGRGGPWSLGLEAEGYYALASGADTFLVQADALGLLRWRPREASGPALAVGLGPLCFVSEASEQAGGAAAYEDLRLGCLLGAEGSWAWHLGRSRLSIEPFLRGYLSATWAHRAGTSLSPGLAGDSPDFRASADAGIRLRWENNN